MRLVIEEMRRVLRYLEYSTSTWRQRARGRSGVPAEVGEGLASYAEKKARYVDRQARKFATQWYPLLRDMGFSTHLSEWPAQYLESARAAAPVRKSKSVKRSSRPRPAASSDAESGISEDGYDEISMRSSDADSSDVDLTE